MIVPATQRAVESFADRNGFLRAVLGVAALLEKVDALIDSSADGSRSEATVGEGDPVLLAVLGAVSLRRCVGGHVDRMVREGAPKPDVAGTQARREAGLLR
jgi:hypothetical protein